MPILVYVEIRSPLYPDMLLPDWVHAPNALKVMKATQQPNIPVVEVRDQTTGITFLLRTAYDMTHASLMQQIEQLLRAPQGRMIIEDIEGDPWTYPAGMSKTNRVVVYPRGGMRRAASRSRSREGQGSLNRGR